MPLELPGFANVHSHAFQRGLRGDVQQRPTEGSSGGSATASNDTFWTWRERMYELAAGLDLEGLESLSRRCFAECLEAGWTAVGEFHYLHRRPDGTPWSDPIATSRVVLRAAEQAGLRIALLWSVYARGGFGRPLGERQARFACDDPDEVRRALDALAGAVDGRRSRAGLALHSVRAVPPDWLGPLAEEARRRELPLHVHVAEQPAEVEACREATGRSPVALLDDAGVLGPDCTAVHATWIDDDDVARLARSGTTVCVCPTTEGDLGDGVARTAELRAAGVPLAVGSDSHAVIDPFAELRMLEHQARAATQRRCVLVDDEGRVAPALRAIGHDRGYAALGLEASGDRVRLDETARLLEGSRDREAAALTAGHPGLVERVEVGGETVVEAGRHVEL